MYLLYDELNEDGIHWNIYRWYGSEIQSNVGNKLLPNVVIKKYKKRKDKMDLFCMCS